MRVRNSRDHKQTNKSQHTSNIIKLENMSLIIHTCANDITFFHPQNTHRFLEEFFTVSALVVLGIVFMCETA